MSTAEVYEGRVPTFEVVAANVRAEAARRGYKQTTLATALGQSQGAITKKWKGYSKWSWDDLDDLAELFDMEPWQFAVDTGALKSGTPARWVSPAGAAARPKGLEPPTFWLVSDDAATGSEGAAVIDFAVERALRRAA